MARCTASNIEFDFSRAISVAEHDATNPKCDGVSIADGNSSWPGVDFRLEVDSQTWIWLEVKNWRMRRAHTFAHSLSEKFATEMRGKLLGTAAYLAWRSQFTQARVSYVLLFQPPTGADAALLGPFNVLLRSKIKIPSGLDITFKAIDLAMWNDLYAEYPARQVR